MKKLLAAFLCLFALSAHGQVKISDLTQVSPALGTDLVPMSNTTRSTSSSYVLSVATIGAYVLGAGSPATFSTTVIAAGTATTAVSPLRITQTQNAAVVHPGVVIDITQTSGSANSAIMQLKGGGLAGWVFHYPVPGNYNPSFTIGGGLSGTDYTSNAMFKVDAYGARVALSKSIPFQWSNSTSNVTTAATSLSVVSDGVVGVGTGAAGSTAGKLVANIVQTEPGSASLPGLALGEANTGWYRSSVGAIDASVGGVRALSLISSGLYMQAGSGNAFNMTGASTANILFGSGTSVNLSNSATGVLAVGTGTAGSTAGAIVANAITAGAIVVNNVVDGTNVLTTSRNGGPSGVGAMVTIGSSNGANTGLKIGYSQSGYGAIYPGNVTPATGNYALLVEAAGGLTRLNTATGSINLCVNNSCYLTMSTTALTTDYNIALGSTGAPFGSLFLLKTVTGVGTTGAQVINKPTGTVNLASTDTSVVVTNSLVATTSIILATAGTNDATCAVKNVVAAAGSFTINMTAACSAETRVNFLVTN